MEEFFLFKSSHPKTYFFRYKNQFETPETKVSPAYRKQASRLLYPSLLCTLYLACLPQAGTSYIFCLATNY
jgi:chemotaxis methyl-accepting protein methylase